jgi:hypothetical protein
VLSQAHRRGRPNRHTHERIPAHQLPSPLITPQIGLALSSVRFHPDVEQVVLRHPSRVRLTSGWRCDRSSCRRATPPRPRQVHAIAHSCRHATTCCRLKPPSSWSAGTALANPAGYAGHAGGGGSRERYRYRHSPRAARDPTQARYDRRLDAPRSRGDEHQSHWRPARSANSVCPRLCD